MLECRTLNYLSRCYKVEGAVLKREGNGTLQGQQIETLATEANGWSLVPRTQTSYSLTSTCHNRSAPLFPLPSKVCSQAQCYMTVISAEYEGIRSSKTASPGVRGHSKPSQVLCNSLSTSWPCIVSHLTLLSSTCVWFPTFLVGSMRRTCSEAVEAYLSVLRTVPSVRCRGQF